MVKIKFIKSPIGAYKLAYRVGAEASFPEHQADLLISEGFAELVEKETFEIEQAIEEMEVEIPEKKIAVKKATKRK